jgi:hypothetical protein
MRKSTGSYPSLTVDTTAKRVVAHAGAALLAATTAREGRVGPGTGDGVAAVDVPVGDTRPRESPFGFGDLGRDRWGLPGRYRAGPHRTGRVRPGCL